MRQFPKPDASAIAEVVAAYFSVRTEWDYGYGEDFDMNERAEAFKAAKAKIRPIIYNGIAEIGWTGKVSVELRWAVRYLDNEAMGEPAASGTERSVDHWPVELTDAEKKEKLLSPEFASKLQPIHLEALGWTAQDLKVPSGGNG